jgi:hypothetical protein
MSSLDGVADIFTGKMRLQFHTFILQFPEYAASCPTMVVLVLVRDGFRERDDDVLKVPCGFDATPDRLPRM